MPSRMARPPSQVENMISHFPPPIIHPPFSPISKKHADLAEEVFGPVLPVMSFETDEEAIQLANDNSYGLGAVIFSGIIEKARQIASIIDAGCIDINNGSHWQPCTPFGGYKASGMGPRAWPSWFSGTVPDQGDCGGLRKC